MNLGKIRVQLVDRILTKRVADASLNEIKDIKNTENVTF